MVILGVSFDTPEDQKAFKDKFDFPYDLLADTDKKMSIGIGSLKYFDKTASPIFQLNKNIDLKNLIQTFTIKIVFNNPFKCLQNLLFYILGEKARNLNHSD